MMAATYNIRVGIAMAIMALLFFAAGCGGSDESSGPFASDDTVCESVQVETVADDERLAESVDCLLAEIDAGRAVTVDFSWFSAAGDPTYTRYAFNGETVLMIQDDRADKNGTGRVQAQRCTTLQPSGRLPAGVDCEQVRHSGFPEVEG